MSTWRIPPVGWCAICLLAHQDEVVAVTMINGTSVCREHVRHLEDPRGDLASKR